MKHWMDRGFSAFQEMCLPDTRYAFGDTPGFADICLIPQLYNARKLRLDLRPYKRLSQIESSCMRLPAFREAKPENQPDAE